MERRKASAPCKARAASQDAEVADLRLSAFRFLLFLSFFLGLQPGPPPVPSDEDRGSDVLSWRWLGKARAKIMRRENKIACTIRPRDSGGGGPLELAKRANRGGGGAGLDVSLSSKEFRRVQRPLHHPASQAQPTLRVGVLYVKHGGRRPPMPPPPLSRWRMKERGLVRAALMV
jgi:hypothetical protein